MFNPQTCARDIERLCKSGMGEADVIRKDPLGYLDKYCFDILESESDEKRSAVCDFWDKYKQYTGKSFDEMGEEVSSAFVKDFRALVEL